jgi:hypothetical protein
MLLSSLKNEHDMVTLQCKASHLSSSALQEYAWLVGGVDDIGGKFFELDLHMVMHRDVCDSNEAAANQSPSIKQVQAVQ